jgi:hypothetical protein
MNVARSALCCLVLLATPAPALGQGAFGDLKFEQDVERVIKEIDRFRRSGDQESNSGGERESPSDSSSGQSEQERRRRDLIRQAEAEARAQRAREAQRRAVEAELRKHRERAIAAAAANVDKADRIAAQATREWREAFANEAELAARWRYATQLLDLAERDGARLVWGLDGKIDASLREAERELRARIDALRERMNAYALLFGQLRPPLQFYKTTFLQFEPFTRSRLAENYLNEAQADSRQLERVLPKVRQAHAELEEDSARLVTDARAFHALVESARESSRPWLVRRWDTIRAESAASDPWRGDVLHALRSLREPPAIHRPQRLADLKPGDVVLFAPSGATSQMLHVAGVFLSGRPTRDNPAAHAATFVGRDAAGRVLFLDHVAGRGSHIKGETEFIQEYGGRKKYVARPQSVVNGRVLLEAAIKAAQETRSTSGSDYGLLGGDTVCSEKAALLIGKATGADLIRARIGPVDVHPSDFFDDERLGWYFVVNPMSD